MGVRAARPIVYGVSLAVLAAAVWLRWLIEPVLAGKLPFVTQFGAIAAAVWLGGARPALLVTVLGYAACWWLFIRPWGRFDEVQNLVGFAAYVATGAIIIAFGEALLRAQRRVRDEHARLRVTFASIGDAVITTDAAGRVTYLNAVAESLTGWAHGDAEGQPLETVFRIVGEETRAPAPNPVSRVLREGVIAGLANHTILIRKDGAERPIDDSAAPVRDDRGRLVGCILVFRDISARRRVERQVWNSRELLRITLASIGDAVITTNAEGRITFLNAVAESLTGWKVDEVAGQPLDTVFRIINEQTRQSVDSPTGRVLREGVVVGLANHTLLVRRDGTELAIDDSAAPIRSKAGEVIGCVLIFHDVTKRREVEAEREELLAIAERARGEAETALATLARVQSITEAALIDLPFDQLLRELVSRVCEALGSETCTLLLNDDGILHARAAVGVDEQARARVRVPVGSGFAGRIAQERRPRLLNDVSGSEIVSDYLHEKGVRALAGVPLLSGEGDVLGVLHVGSVRARAFGEADVHVLQVAAERVALAVEHAARRDAEHRARVEAERANTMMRRVERIADAMLAELSLDGMLHEALLRVREALGADVAVMLLTRLDEEDQEETQGLSVRAVVGVAEKDEIGLRVPLGSGFCGLVAKERRAVAWNDARPEQLALPFLRRMGVRSLAGVPLLSAGRLLGVLQVGSVEPREFQSDDVELLQRAATPIALAIERTARIEAERRARETLETSNRAKDEFLAMLGHELRNPLSAVRNAIATASLDEARRARALEIARRQAEQLGRLIDDLLDVARITQGKVALRKERVSLAEIVERAVDSVRPFVESRGLRLDVTLPGQPIRLEADPARLEQVIVNLLSNAAKYTEAGGRVELAAAREADDAVVRIRDTGVGIAPNVLPHVWDLFTQAGRTPDRAQGGLGIGLTVARRLVDLHGGRIEAHSDGLGKGAEFVVRLAALPGTTEEPRPAKPAEPAPPRATARILLVEDNPDAAESLTMLLELLGHRVRSVPEGVAALETARANPPDVMLVDIGLPGMDGYEVARRVRRDPGLKDVVLVALTGYGREEDKRAAMAAGFDYHLVKPVNADALHGLVSRLGKHDADEPPTIH